MSAVLLVLDLALCIALVEDTEFPFVLMTRRNLYQFNAGPMTMRTATVVIRATPSA